MDNLSNLNTTPNDFTIPPVVTTTRCDTTPPADSLATDHEVSSDHEISNYVMAFFSEQSQEEEVDGSTHDFDQALAFFLKPTSDSELEATKSGLDISSNKPAPANITTSIFPINTSHIVVNHHNGQRAGDRTGSSSHKYATNSALIMLFLNTLNAEESVGWKYINLTHNQPYYEHEFYLSLFTEICIEIEASAPQTKCFIEILLDYPIFFEFLEYVCGLTPPTDSVVQTKNLKMSLDLIAHSLSYINNDKLPKDILYKRIGKIIEFLNRYGHTTAKWQELNTLFPPISYPMPNPTITPNPNWTEWDPPKPTPSPQQQVITEILNPVPPPLIPLSEQTVPRRQIKASPPSAFQLLSQSPFINHPNNKFDFNELEVINTYFNQKNKRLYQFIGDVSDPIKLHAYSLPDVYSTDFLSGLLEKTPLNQKRANMQSHKKKMMESTFYVYLFLLRVPQQTIPQKPVYFIDILFNCPEFFEYAEHLIKSDFITTRYTKILSRHTATLAEHLLKLIRNNAFNQLAYHRINIIHQLLNFKNLDCPIWANLGDSLYKWKAGLTIPQYSTSELSLFIQSSDATDHSSNADLVAPAPKKTLPKLSLAPLDTSKMPTVDPQTRTRAFESFINFIEANPARKRNFLRAMQINGGDCCVYLNDLASEEGFIAQLKKLIPSKIEQRHPYKELFFHFGIHIKTDSSPINNFSGYNYLFLKSTPNNEGSLLNADFIRHIIPSLFEYKKQQWKYLIKASLANEPITYRDRGIEKAPSMVLAQDRDRAIILPFEMSISGSWSSENKGWNGYVSRCNKDVKGSCIHFLKEHIDSDIELNENDTIHLRVDQLDKLEATVKEQYGQNKFDIRILPYAGKISNGLDNDQMVIKEAEIIPSSMEVCTGVTTVKENGELLGKRSATQRDDQDFEQVMVNKRKRLEAGPGWSYLKQRKEDIVLKSFSLEGSTSAANQDNDGGTDSDGHLLPIRKPNDPLKEIISDDETFWNLSLRGIELVNEKVKQSSAKVKGNALEPLEYPILGQLHIEAENTDAPAGVTFPYTLSIKPYQRQALAQIYTLKAKGITPLCSLHMGLGKTVIYMNMIADALAKMKEGITVILVPAALRTKTVEELYHWLAEAKFSAYLALCHHDKVEFTRTWQKQLMEICLNMNKEGAKSSKPSPALLLSKLKPLMMVADQLDIETLRKDAGGGFKGMIHLFDSVLMQGANEFLKTISTVPKLRALAIELDNVYVDDRTQELYLEECPTLGEFAQLAKLTLAPRITLSQNDFKELTVEECQRLIAFPMEEIFNPASASSADKKKALESTNGILVLGYENLFQMKAELFMKKHRLVIADEASKYHTIMTALNKLLTEYAAALKGGDSPAHLYPFTATPFENALSELLELLNISNTILGPDGKPKSCAFSSASIAALNALQDLAVKAVVDLIPSKDLAGAMDLFRNALLKSFAHRRGLSEILNKIVLARGLKDSAVLEDWDQQIPTSKKKNVRLSIPTENSDLKTRVDSILTSIYARHSKNDIVLHTDLLKASSQLFAYYLDTDWTSDTINLTKAEPDLLRTIVDKIANQIEAYKNDNTSLDRHQYVRDLIENSDIQQAIRGSKKLIIVRQYEIEDHVLKLVLETHYKKTVVIFGGSDKEREAAIRSLKDNDDIVLILPLKAGGTGLNLGFVDQMILLGGSFNPALIDQMMARIRRAGWDGIRQFLLVTHANGHEDFIACKAKSKKKMWKFFSSSNISLRDHIAFYAESLLQEALGHYLLRCREKVGYYTDTQGLEHPIREVQKSAGEEESVENRLRTVLNKVIEQLPDQLLIETVAQVTPKESHYLNPSEWVRFPLPTAMTWEDVTKIASYMADPVNSKRSSSTFGPFCNFILDEKAAPKHASAIAVMKQQEEIRIKDLRPYLPEQGSTDIEIYFDDRKGYKTITKGKIDDKVSLVKVHVAKNSSGQNEYELLIPKKTALQWASEYRSAPVQRMTPINNKIEHPTQESWLRIPLKRGFDKTQASKIASYLADPRNGKSLPDSLKRFCYWVVNSKDQLSIKNTFENIRNGQSIGIEDTVNSIPHNQDHKANIYQFANNGYQCIGKPHIGAVGSLFQRTPDQYEVLIPKTTALEWKKAAVPMGIPNIGNSCYLNAALQFLLAIPGLQQRLQETNEFNNKVFKSLTTVLKSSGSDDMHAAMTTLRRDLFDLNVYDREIDGEGLYKQQDPAQFVERVLIDIGQTFETKIVKSVTGTDIRREEIQPMSLLQVPMSVSDTNLTIQALCDRLFDPVEINDPANAWRPDDTLYECYQDRLRLANPAPRHVLVHFKRFSVDNDEMTDDGTPIVRKIDSAIQFPPNQQVDLSKAFDRPVSAQYKVIAALQHTGNINEGHHKTFINHPDGWYELNDHHVQQCHNIQRELEHTYLLLLEQLDVKE